MDNIELIKVVGGIIVAALGVFFGGKLLFRNNSKEVNQKKGGTQISFIDSNENKVSVGENAKSKKKN